MDFQIVEGTLLSTSVSTPVQVAPTTKRASHEAFLRANSRAYEWLVEKAQRIDWRKNADTVLYSVALAAQFAAKFHPGRFADGAIDNLALKIGAQLSDLPADAVGFVLPVDQTGARRRVLHVASRILEIGGHTRMLHHWVRNDQSSSHSLVLVDQGDDPIPKWMFEAVRSSGGNLQVLPQGSGLCQKAQWLREIARRNADLVVLHHNASDVVPTVAFAVTDCPPVALLNHADHVFWLGSTVADLVINLRTAGSVHTAMRRFVSTNTVLPIPLADHQGRVSRQDARQALGVPEEHVVLLSVGRPEKYQPRGPYDFVETARKILDRQPTTHLYVVGVSEQGIAPYLRCAVHERLHLVGSMEDPSLYRAAADIYLESFPFGSNTALLEAALSGLPVIPAYAPLFPLLVADNDALRDLLPNPENELEYVERVELLIQQPKQRVELGAKLRKRLLVDHVGEGWLHHLDALYQQTDCLTHSPRPIPSSPCSTKNADVSLSQWNVMADGKTNFVVTSRDAIAAVLRHDAFLARYVGDYAMARRYAWRAILSNPYRWVSWRLLVVTVLGRAGRSIRRLLRPA